MLKYTVKRLAQSLVTILLIATIVFLLMRCLPTDYYFTKEQLMKFTEEQKYAALEAAGLTDPIGTQLLHFYSSDAAVIAAGYERLRVICGTYLLCGIMDTLASSLRGLGYSVLPMVVSLVGSCLLRLVWIATIFQLNRTPFMLYISYPISWVLTAAVHLACLLVVRHKMRQRGQTLQAA